MAVRRPRIKAAANLMNVKRKKTLDQDVNLPQSAKRIYDDNNSNVSKVEETQSQTVLGNVQEKNTTGEQGSVVNSNSNFESESINAHGNDNASQECNNELENNSSVDESVPTASTNCSESVPETEHGNNYFKYPPKMDYNRTLSQSTSAGGVVNTADDTFPSDVEVNIIQLDLQKSNNGFPMSPTKGQSRQRIRPIPSFGQRRNSFVASSPSPHTGDDSNGASPEFAIPIAQKRERHYSGSLSQSSNSSTLPSHHYHTPHKFQPTMGGRIRTESGCSVFSDSYIGSGKTRKTDEHGHKHLTRRDFEARFTKGVPEKSSLKMFDLIYYNPITNPMEQKHNPTNINHKSAKTDNASANSMDIREDVKQLATTEPAATAIPVPQLKLNSNGELILDDKSLEIETTAEQEARKVLANSSLIFLDENTGMNGFYKRQKRTKEWFADETIKFYRCLQTIGTDFSLMCQLFPTRSRRDLKLKFKKEERCNGALINKALLYPKIFNIDELKKQLDTEERERSEADRKWKEIKMKEVKLGKKVHIKASCGARVLKDGDDIYRNEHIFARKFNKRSARYKADTAKSKNNHELQYEKKSKTKSRHSSAPQKTVSNTVAQVPVKMEKIKSEKKGESENTGKNCSADVMNFNEATQLECELNDLLHTDATETHLQGNAESNTEYHFTADYKSKELNKHNKTLVNLECSTVVDLDILSETRKQTCTTEESTTNLSKSKGELDETDIQQILNELAEGSLVLVSTLDPDNADKVVNEIYMVNTDTRELLDEPLDIPEAIVQGILSVMN